MKKTASGFTLIELLVTISIIAILATIGLVAYSSVMKQGRDAKRQADLRSIQSALNQYFIDQGFYPFTTGSQGLDDLLSASPPPSFTSSTGNPSIPPSPKTYMNFLPQDPTGTLCYRYEALPNTPCDNSTTKKCTGYCLYVNLENSNPGRPVTCTTYSGYNFAVTPP